jgi:glycosyltransferase involved in cell wall biosynthesis
MRIAFFRYSLFNRGGDRLSLAYANHLASVGHDVTLYVKEMDTVFTVSPALQVRKVPCSHRAGFLLYAAAHNLGHQVVIVDIIHLHLLLSLRNRVIYYAQADDVEYYDSALMRTVVDLLYRFHFSTRAPMISMSQHLTDIFTARYGAVNARTIRTGIDHGAFFPDPDGQLCSGKGDKKAVVFMARGDHFRKGYDLAMKVFQLLEEEMSDRMELWVCGNTLPEQSFAFKIRNFGVVEDSRLRQILSSADMLFYPSRHEGFGLFPLEAMACGCLVVTTDAIPYARNITSIMTSPREDIADLSDNVRTLVHDHELCNSMKVRAIRDASMFDFEESKLAFETAVNAIVSGSV